MSVSCSPPYCLETRQSKLTEMKTKVCGFPSCNSVPGLLQGMASKKMIAIKYYVCVCRLIAISLLKSRHNTISFRVYEYVSGPCQFLCKIFFFLYLSSCCPMEPIKYKCSDIFFRFDEIKIQTFQGFYFVLFYCCFCQLIHANFTAH